MNLTDDQLRSLRAWCNSDADLVSALKLLASATAEDIAHDVHTRIDALYSVDEPDERWGHPVSALAIDAARAAANGRWAVNENQRVDALAAKAEAGKGLLPYVQHGRLCHTTDPLTPNDCSCGLGEVLARWEAVENG